MGISVFNWPWLRDTLIRDGDDTNSSYDFGHDILPGAVRDNMVKAYDVAVQEPGFYWRDVGTLDAMRKTCIHLMAKTPHSPRPVYPMGGATTDQPTLILQQGSVVLSGAVVSCGARLKNAIVAPGCVVPRDLEVGYDVNEDANHFRVTPEGTVLITPVMLARRSAGSRRAHLMPITARKALQKVTP